MNGTGEGRLLDADPLRGAGEMLLLSDGDEIPNVA